MTHFKNLILSMLAGWVTAWVTVVGCASADSIAHATRHDSWTDVVNGALIYAVYTLIVVAAAWLLVATPYYFFCIHKGWIQSTYAHLSLSALLAAGFTGLMVQGEAEAWLGLGAPAVLSALAGTFVLLCRNPPNANTQSSIP